MLLCMDLRKHCLETEAKRQYNQCISDYFRQEDPELEKKIEFLRQVLENVDLKGLRAKFAELQGGCESEVNMGRNSKGEFYITIRGETVFRQPLV